MTTTDREHTPPSDAELDEWDKHYHETKARLVRLGVDTIDPWLTERQRLIAEVRRLRAERSAYSERLWYLLANGVIASDEDGNLVLCVTLAPSSGEDWQAGDVGLTQDEADYLNGRRTRTPIDGPANVQRIIDAARQEPTPRSTWRTKGTSCENCGRGLMDHENQLYCPTEPTPNCPHCHHLWSKHVSGGECAVRVDSAYTHDNTRPCGCKAQEPTP